MSAEPVPPPWLHQRLAEAMLQTIRTLPAGTRLPSERALAKHFACNVVTVRRMLARLVRAGQVHRRRGSGTYVGGGGGGTHTAELAQPAAATAPAGVGETSAGEAAPAAAPGVTRLGLLLPPGGGGHEQRIVAALGAAAMAAPVEVCTAWTDDFGAPALAQAEALARRGCQALIVPWFPYTCDLAMMDFVRAATLPVTLGTTLPGLERQGCATLERYGRNLMVTPWALGYYLQRLGHRRIALLVPSEDDPAVMIQLTAYKAFARRAGLTPESGQIGPTAADADRLAERWQAWRGDLAVICHDDTHALRLLAAMRKRGLAAPADFALVSAQESDWCRYADPPLTTLRPDYDWLGRALVTHALGQAAGELRQATTKPLLRMVVRGSCGGLPRLSPELLRDLAARGLAVATEVSRDPDDDVGENPDDAAYDGGDDAAATATAAPAVADATAPAANAPPALPPLDR